MPLLRPDNHDRCRGGAALLLPFGALAGAGTLLAVAKEAPASASAPPSTLFPGTPGTPGAPGAPGTPGTPGAPGTPGGTTPTSCQTVCLPQSVADACCGGGGSSAPSTPAPTPPTRSGLVLPPCWSALDTSSRTAVAAFYLLLSRFPPCPPDGSIPWLAGIYNGGAGGYRLTQAVAYMVITVPSAEFLNDIATLSGGTAAGWVSQAFGRILGRSPSATDLAFWSGYYTGNGAKQTALAIAVGDSEFNNRVANTLSSWGG